MLIKDIQREPFEGLGKPEALKSNLSGYWSRRIDGEHRLVYEVNDTQSKLVISFISVSLPKIMSECRLCNVFLLPTTNCLNMITLLLCLNQDLRDLRIFRIKNLNFMDYYGWFWVYPVNSLIR